jgi:hypothetical protein
MPTTFNDAYDQIFGLFRAKWFADTPAITGGPVPEVEYQGMTSIGSPPQDAPWCRISLQHVTNNSAALNPDGVRKRFTVTGVVAVQIFVPIGQGLVLIRQLAPVAKEAFQGVRTADDSIWFREAQISEVGAEGSWFQMNVTASFEYDEFV